MTLNSICFVPKYKREPTKQSGMKRELTKMYRFTQKYNSETRKKNVFFNSCFQVNRDEKNFAFTDAFTVAHTLGATYKVLIVQISLTHYIYSDTFPVDILISSLHPMTTVSYNILPSKVYFNFIGILSNRNGHIFHLWFTEWLNGSVFVSYLRFSCM